MPTIGDLKKNKISASISMGGDDISTTKPKQNTSKEMVLETINTKPKNISASIDMGKPIFETRVAHEYTESKKAAAVSMTTGKEPAKKSNNRVAASFKSLPKDPTDDLGVETKVSPENEIFKEGGEFDQYVKEKTKEVQQWYQEEVEKAEQKAAEKEAEEQSDSNSKEEEEIEDIETTILPATNGRVIDITRKEKSPMNEDDKYLIDDSDIEEETEDFEDEFEEEEESVDTSEKEEPEDEPVYVNDSNVHNAEEVVSTEPIQEESNKSSREKIDRVTRRIMSVDVDEDLDEEESEVETEEDDTLEILRSLISEKIVPVSKKLDISSFAIAKKPVASNSIFETKEAAIAKWVLPATGTCILLREISGSNLEVMRSLLSRRIPDMRGVLKIIYDHIVSPKPESFDVWLKSVAFADYDHLFMAIYISAFVESNFLPIDCAECKKPYLTEDIDIMDMVKFKSPEAEEKFNKLYNSEASNPHGLYVTENVPISNKFAVAFKEPSIYSVLIESQYFDDRYNKKYQQAIAIMPYIDEVYYIDMANHKLVPVEFKLYANDPAKTARMKIKKIDAILNSLNVDENAVLSTYTDNINKRSDWFTYRIPESTCPNCKHVNAAEEDQTASSLVFLRNRLGALATI